MKVFCTQCWTQSDASAVTCPKCGAALAADERSYEEKLLRSLDHPIKEVRLRACWLIGEKELEAAADKLMATATNDVDMFVRHAAIQALGHLHSPAIAEFLEAQLRTDDRWMEVDVKKSLNRLRRGALIDSQSKAG